MTRNDQPRPDLDAAVDAVLPSLTAVSDDAAAASLRRTRLALADAAPAREGVGAWRWAAPAVALAAAAIVAALVWRPGPSTDVPRGATADARPSAPLPPLLAARPAAVAPISRAPRAVPPQRLARAPRVEATSVAPAEETPRLDRLRAFVRAVQRIPEDAWSRSVARADMPVIVPDVPVTSIDVTPLASPADVAIEPLAPGEP